MIRLNVEKELDGASGPLALAIELEIPFGQKLALTGPSGGGKTTLLRMLAGLERPDRGRIEVEGQVWDAPSDRLFVPPQRRSIGMAFQDYALFPHLTIRKNLAFAQPRTAAPETVDRMLHSIGLERLADRYPRHLSGGQKQRVSLARALLRHPELLLLDEPLSALDLITRDRLQRLLQEEFGRRRFTLLLVTHQLAEMKRLTERVVWIDHGKVLADGSPDEVISHFYDLSE